MKRLRFVKERISFLIKTGNHWECNHLLLAERGKKRQRKFKYNVYNRYVIENLLKFIYIMIGMLSICHESLITVANREHTYATVLMKQLNIDANTNYRRNNV